MLAIEILFLIEALLHGKPERT